MKEYEMHLVPRPRCPHAHREPGPPGCRDGWYCLEGCDRDEPFYLCREQEVRNKFGDTLTPLGKILGSACGPKKGES